MIRQPVSPFTENPWCADTGSVNTTKNTLPLRVVELSLQWPEMPGHTEARTTFQERMHVLRSVTEPRVLKCSRMGEGNERREKLVLLE